MTFDQVKRALKAKLSSKKDMPDWYYQRLEKCIQCEYNSGNKEKLSFKDRIRISHNFGNDACLICTCGIQDKASDPEEQCADTPPRWDKIKEISTTKSDNDKLINKSPEKVDIKGAGLGHFIANYGTISYNSDSNITVVLKLGEVDKHTVKASCGCTIPKVVRNGSEFTINIVYDTKRKGYFKKDVKFIYNKLGEPLDKLIIITIEGTVV